MANNEHLNGVSELNVEVDIGNLNGENVGGNGNQRLGTVRDRLFHAMVVKVAVSYSSNVSPRFRTLIEFVVLSFAICMLSTLVYIHLTHSRYPGTCLDSIKHSWPRNGILRVEVIKNLPEFEASLIEVDNESTPYNLKDILISGGKLTVRDGQPRYTIQDLHFFFNEEVHDDAELVVFQPKVQPLFEYVVEYSFHHGLLKLSQDMRKYYKVDQLTYRIDGENDVCLSNWRNRFLTKYIGGGVAEVVMSSLKSLAENDTDKGYLKDLLHLEHYHFISANVSNYSYITAMLIMLIFTFAISMLLRFSHHQIFLFIIDLLQMFELNEPLVFPVAPLLTVILALVGMEAIMSEIFNDTSTAFYVILLVWMADQYDAICCRSSVSRKHWLRFFYLYHFAFYAYQYKFGGQYNVFALLTSAFFIFHVMIFFFHHYEIPLILHQEQLFRVVGAAQQEAGQTGNGELILVNRGTPAGELRTGENVAVPRMDDTAPILENVNSSMGTSAPLDVQVTENLSHEQFQPDSSPIPTVHRTIVFSQQIPSTSESSRNQPQSSSEVLPDVADEVASSVVDNVINELFGENQ